MKLKLNDRVKVLEDPEHRDPIWIARHGKTGTVLEIQGSYVGVRFDDQSLNGQLWADYRCVYYKVSSLEKIL